jgi:hypothetical protein
MTFYQCADPDPYVFGPPGSASGTVRQRYGSEDPDPYQNVTDPQHCWKLFNVDTEKVDINCGTGLTLESTE